MAVNVGRGLFRAWIVVAVLWTISASAFTYIVMAADTLRGPYQPMAIYKKPGPYTDAEVFGPFYGLVKSPSAERLKVEFKRVSYSDWSKWDKDETMLKVEMPDDSRIFMTKEYNQADRDYIAKQFWDQRWVRWTDIATMAALWSAIPMLILFVVGYALLWIGRGFASR
jgi:hypothetical protein